MGKIFSIATILLVILIFFGTALAAPFLVCDPYPATGAQPTYFELVFDAGAPVQSPPQDVTGGKRLHYDLSSLGMGNHNVTAKACNEWGCSSAVPFAFTKAVPGGPTGIGLSSQ